MATSKDADSSGTDPSVAEAADDPNRTTSEVESSGPDAADSEGAPEVSGDVEQEELPEWEALTPELVEDEAIRGDFMLRWSVVLLALLLAFAEMTETSTLVHVKTGQYIASHGWWPPATDVFSYTANDRPWINLSWKFDLLLAGIFAIAGATGLSLLKALLAALAFGLIVHTNKPGVSTWWGSICAALAVVVSYPQFTARPELVTILGIAATLWLLVRWQERGPSNILWGLPALFFVWSNLDPRMFLGMALVLLFAAGLWVDSMRGNSGRIERERLKQIGIVAALCLLASLLNPFGYHSLTSGISLYGTEYPAFRQYYVVTAKAPPPTGHWQSSLQFYPMTSKVIWKWLNHHSIAGLMLIVTTAVIFVLNRSRLNCAHVFVGLGFLGFALAGSHELAAASVVFSVLVTLNAQEWYRTNFRRSYSVETSKLIFSRGGRALTVLALLGLTYLAISGRISAGQNRRTGIGFHSSLNSAIESLKDDLADSLDGRPFNFALNQGDLFIWSDQKVFVDNRVALFAGTGASDVLGRHDRTRHALRRPKDDLSLEDGADIWKPTFDEFNVTHVLPHMFGANPDYITYEDLLASSDWQLTRLGAAAAVFYRTDTDDPALKKYLDDHQTRFSKLAFPADAPKLIVRPDEWARPRSIYEKYLSLPSQADPNAIQQARHYRRHLAAGYLGKLELSVDELVPLAHLVIRTANEGLVDNPQSATGHRILGSAYEILGRLETEIAGTFGGVAPETRRFYQAISAYSQALVIEPNDPGSLLRLIDLYSRKNKPDLALRAVEDYRQLMDQNTDVRGAATQLEQGFEEPSSTLIQTVDGASQQVDSLLQTDQDRLQIALVAYHQFGCVLKALEVLQSAEGAIGQSAEVQKLQALFLLEAGRPQDAFEVITRLTKTGYAQWRTPAAFTSLAKADYARAVSLWSTAADEMQTGRITQVQPALSANTSMRTEVAIMLFNVALCHLETGETELAVKALHQTLNVMPETEFRPLIGFYLAALTGETIDLIPPSDRIPIEPDMFATEEEAKPAE